MTVAPYGTQSAWTAAAASSVTVDKPTGLTAGDRLVALVFCSRHSYPTFNTPSGWTAGTVLNGAPFFDVATYNRWALFHKVADAADAAASNFTFTASTADKRLGVVIFGVSGLSGFDVDARARAAATTSPLVLSGGIAPAGGGGLLIVASGFTFGGGITSVAGPALATDNPTWKNLYPDTAFDGSRVRVDYAVREASSSTGDISQSAVGSGSMYGFMGVAAFAADRSMTPMRGIW